MATSAWVPVSIPRWQWRTFGTDLSWLDRRLSTPVWVESRPVTEVHLVCRCSAHHAWLSAAVLTLQWRKEVGAGGFELWDTILRTGAPFGASSMDRLFSAWGLTRPEIGPEGVGVAEFLAGPVAATPSVRAIEVERRGRHAAIDGIACSFESVTAGASRPFQSFAIEHEDPALMSQLVRDLGLEAVANTHFLQGLKQALDLQ